MKTLKTVSSIGIVTLSLGLGACQKQDTAATNTSEKQAAAPVKTLSIGYKSRL
jgi:sulfonate transport system substrate-binding protein